MSLHLNGSPLSRRSLASAACSLSAALVIACGAAPEAPPETHEGVSSAALTELVVNGTFSGTTTAPWWSGPNTSSRVDAGRWRVDVAGGTVNPWDAPIGQDGIVLANGQAYTLSFTASATAPVTVRATVQLGSAPYTAPLDQQISLDGTPRRFTFPFTSSLSTGAGQVTFQVGGRGAFTLHLDDISLTTGSSTGSGPLGMTSGFYVDPNSNPATWVRNNSWDSRAARIQSAIASRPGARWFGNWSGDIASAVSGFVAAADAADKLPVLVAYNIPGRDCGSHSGGGAGSPEAYRTWISNFVTGLGTRPAIVIIEPDAVAQLDCLPNDTERQTRLGLLRYATEQLRARAPNTWAYLDGGNATWIAADTMAQRLESAGARNIRGFALNVSNFHTTAASASYASAVNTALNNRYGYTLPFVVDTSRNGNGSNGEWCNPGGRRLGTPSQVGGGAELLLWVKVPGDSDGQCGIAPNTPAGTFSPDLAIRLIDGT
ncbi:glycoside hydrolase family 6 protein [Pyxidicoccus xibeiensis]|uniref:glycoside hydrolase family 6 protein n=1 Tax=Pyxidicoccus xibeiensis TaxID=2906759 RepID=UPI0020A70460|nr:glycoside hydrolase family 6 protein [Pyxidicoccus xibeiensis]MCP3138160.1 glycoside hydrolase family 6 protein [Pyxidicoccus xibeiensis]